MSTQQHNPYIGPRTFLREESEFFFGRDREGRDIGALIASERLVVFYAQSGAGKSSIVNTRLIPDMENNRYEVLPVGRVSGETPDGVNANNVYIYNLMHSLVQHETNPNEIAGLSLSQFLSCLNADENGYFYDNGPLPDPAALTGIAPWRRALIIDQFEEIFSTHHEAWAKRQDFFIQLAQAIENDPYLWVVLVMREDYIAHLDPYAHLLPSGLRVRYYMQRLSRDSALNAIKKPAEKAGRPFARGVAEKLVDDLSSIKVQKIDGSTGMLPGQFVEAVQLQVVCFSLWDNLSAGTEITEQDLLVIGNVDDALGKYYADRIASVAKAKGIKERTLREWIERKLIAPGGVRNMVLQDTKTTDGIRDDVIQALQSDLVRAENRGGAVWYELTHDRLVEPILEDNKKWFDINLSPLQRQATLWNDQERNESWLLRDEALVEVEKWASANLDEMTDLETKFLAACREHQAEIQSKLDQKARETRRLRQFTAIAGLLALLAIITAVYAFRLQSEANVAKLEAEQNALNASKAEANAKIARDAAIESQNDAIASKAEAEKEANKALAGYLASQANLETNSDYPLALLMGVEAYKREDTILTRTTLFDLLQTTPYKRNFDFNGAVTSVAVSPTGEWIATAACNTNNLNSQLCTKGGFKIFKADIDGEFKEPPASVDFGIIYSMIFFDHEGSLVLATGGCVPQGCSADKGQISLWSIAGDGTPTLLNVAIGSEHQGLVKTLAFDPNRNILASGSYDTFVLLWDISDFGHPRLLGKLDHDSFVNSVAFSSDGTTLAAAGDDRIVYLWNVSNIKKDDLRQKFDSNKYKEHNAPVTSVAFSPDGTTLASASDDRTVLLWKFDAASHSLTGDPIELQGHTGYIKSVAFNTDGTLLASAGFDNNILLWNTKSEQVEQIGPPLSLHTEAVNAIAFGLHTQNDQNAPFLISVSDDRSAIQWDLTGRRPVSRTFQWGSSSPPTTEGELVHHIHGQEISLEYRSGGDSFLVITGFNSRVQVLGIDARKLLTADQNQANTGSGTTVTITPNEWVTEWLIDPKEWVTLACEALHQALTPQQIEDYRTSDPRLSNACK